MRGQAESLKSGACQPAGIPPQACGEGFVPTDGQGCEPILPAAPCAPGLMAVPGGRYSRERAAKLVAELKAADERALENLKRALAVLRG